MPQPTKGPRLGGSPAHQRLILANLATQLFEHQRITTTEAKARRLRPYAERLITKAKVGDLHNIRQIAKLIRDKDVIYKLVHEIGPFFADREGGYTRITKLGFRKGDNASMVQIELVLEPVKPKAKSTKAPAKAAPKAAEAPAEDVVEDAPADETVDETAAEVEESTPDVENETVADEVADADAVDADAKTEDDAK